jgi:hypothetical protein
MAIREEGNTGNVLEREKPREDAQKVENENMSLIRIWSITY